MVQGRSPFLYPAHNTQLYSLVFLVPAFIFIASVQITSSTSVTVPLPSHRVLCLCFPKFARKSTKKAQKVPSFLPFHLLGIPSLLSHRGTSSTFPFFEKTENPSVQQVAPSATTASPVMCCQYFNKGLL